MYITAKRIRKDYDISTSCLRKWASKGQVEVRLLPGGKRLYKQADIYQILGENQHVPQKESIIYARVSSSHQKEDLERQIQELQRAYPNHRVISDIGSGLNFQKKGLQTLLELVFNRTVQEVVVAYKDRLCRIGFDLFETIFRSHQVRLLVQNQTLGGRQEELDEDLLSIVNVFVAKNNGRRSANNRKRRREEQDGESEKSAVASDKKADKDSQEMVRDLPMDLQPMRSSLTLEGIGNPLQSRSIAGVPENTDDQ